MPGVPEKRQSIRPSGRMIMALLAAILAMVAVWFAVTAAVQAGGEDCPNVKESGASSNQCR